MTNLIMNPKSGKWITVGGKTHHTLITQGVLNRDTLDIGKVSVVPGSRAKRTKACLEIHSKSTHVTNIMEIAKQLTVPPLDLIEYLQRKHYPNLKIIMNGKQIRLIIEGVEPYVDNCIYDYIKEEMNIDWNQ